MQLRMSCIISLFYIKPQHDSILRGSNGSCIISLFYIKPQPQSIAIALLISCIISLFYIKPQHHEQGVYCRLVALYRYSTSNHNSCIAIYFAYRVALYRYSTSNHNQ